MSRDPLDALAPSASWGFVTISDSADAPVAWRYLLLTASGTLRVTNMSGVEVIIPALPAGTYFMGGVRRVWATGGGLNAGATGTVIGFV